MFVIAKMSVRAVEDYGPSRKVVFGCVHDSGINVGDNPENRAFTQATPSGEAWMTIDNRFVWDCFRPASYNEDRTFDYKSAEHYVVFISAKDYSLEQVRAALAELGK